MRALLKLNVRQLDAVNKRGHISINLIQDLVVNAALPDTDTHTHTQSNAIAAPAFRYGHLLPADKIRRPGGEWAYRLVVLAGAELAIPQVR
jgi:hypothetical protein